MRDDPRTRLIARLIPLAPDLAAKLWGVRQVRDLPADVRGEIADVLGNEAAARGFDRYGRPNAYGDELDTLIEALGLDE